MLNVRYFRDGRKAVRIACPRPKTAPPPRYACVANAGPFPVSTVQALEGHREDIENSIGPYSGGLATVFRGNSFRLFEGHEETATGRLETTDSSEARGRTATEVCTTTHTRDIMHKGGKIGKRFFAGQLRLLPALLSMGTALLLQERGRNDAARR